MGVMLESGELSQRVAKQVGYESAEIVPLNIGLQNPSTTGQEIAVDLVNDSLRFV